MKKIKPKKVYEYLFKNYDGVLEYINKTSYPKYLYWDRIRYKAKPKDLTAEEFWYAIKIVRKAQSIDSPIKSESSKFFSWIKLPKLEEFFHEMDMNTGGSLFDFSKDINQGNKFKFITRGVMEEAIASSQLEGAITTRKVAKELLRSGRKPRNKSEHMILNSYVTMKKIEEEYGKSNLDLENIFELHRMIVKDTIPENEAGRFRKDEEDIIVGNNENTIYHTPPKINFLNQEMVRFIKFINDDLETKFIHPVVKAIMIHFWLGYLHPFTDGNGRLARALFYWYLIRKGYWAIVYLPISKMIKKSWAQYRDAYIYSEQDDFDLTYFIDYNVQKIELASKDFKDYISAKASLNKKMSSLAHSKYNLNDRQIQLLQYLYKNHEESTTTSLHMKINEISKITAIKDLKFLKEKDFLDTKKRGRELYYYPTENIEQLFKH
ncbi:MAG: Fic family protein [Candidatus Komeilibacteria bacterium]|nr:Fic family protein [Candidatus Komeilibacteria bacterium]